MMFITVFSLVGGLGPKYKQNSTDFLVDFQELEILESMPNRLGLCSRCSNKL